MHLPGIYKLVLCNVVLLLIVLPLTANLLVFGLGGRPVTVQDFQLRLKLKQQRCPYGICGSIVQYAQTKFSVVQIHIKIVAVFIVFHICCG